MLHHYKNLGYCWSFNSSRLQNFSEAFVFAACFNKIIYSERVKVETKVRKILCEIDLSTYSLEFHFNLLEIIQL